MILVDTSVWIDYFRDANAPEVEMLDRLLGNSALGMIDLVLCELVQGIRHDSQVGAVLKELNRIYVFEACNRDLALKSATNYRRLRSLGFTPRNTIDCILATFCIENDHTLLHHDRDFDVFEKHLGLRVAHPA